jgi:hypothetical protein
LGLKTLVKLRVKLLVVTLKNCVKCRPPSCKRGSNLLNKEWPKLKAKGLFLKQQPPYLST